LKQTAATRPFFAGKCANIEASSHSTALVFVARPETPLMLRCAASGPRRKSASSQTGDDVAPERYSPTGIPVLEPGVRYASILSATATSSSLARWTVPIETGCSGSSGT
jgi:hypothetical protein